MSQEHLYSLQAFVTLHYILNLMDNADALCKNLWESKCYLRLLQSAYRGHLLQFP